MWPPMQNVQFYGYDGTAAFTVALAFGITLLIDALNNATYVAS